MYVSRILTSDVRANFDSTDVLWQITKSHSRVNIGDCPGSYLHMVLSDVEREVTIVWVYPDAFNNLEQRYQWELLLDEMIS